MHHPDVRQKSERFAELHQRDRLLLLPNPWDAGSARILESLGFEALATTGAGIAFSQGVPDHRLARGEMIRRIAEIVDATSLPVTADLQNGFGDSPEDAAKAVLLAAEAGCCGCSIEDDSGRPGARTYPFALAVERVQAAAEAARSLPRPFVLTARCDRFFAGEPDFEDTLRRLQAFDAAGADVLYAPGLTGRADIERLVREVRKPLNVLMAGGREEFDARWLESIGVRRVSVGGYLARVGYGGLIQAATELRDQGRFGASRDVAVSGKDLTGLLSRRG